MLLRPPVPLVNTLYRTTGRTLIRPGIAGRMAMRHASTVPPVVHARLRPSRLLVGLVIGGGAALGAFTVYNRWTEPVPDVLAVTPPHEVSFDELRKHNTKESCWLLINDQVYDATSVLRWHPAGAEIVLKSSGGQDASKAYLAVHKLELLSHLPPTAHLGPIDRSTLPPEITRDEEEEEIFRTAEAQ